MYRGTTPTLNFNFEYNLEELNILALYISFKQGDEIKLEKNLEELKIEGNKVTINLTQEETLKFVANKPIFIQGRLRTSGGAYATNIITTDLKAILKEGEI